MSWDDPLEPFRRAAKALAEAFEDEHVAALTSVSGLSTVVTLHSLADGEDLPDNQSVAATSLPQQANPALDVRLTLAQRLWAVLRAPHLRVCAKCNWRGEAN